MITPSSHSTPELYRGAIYHTPRNPFGDARAPETHSDGALESYSDGALVIAQGRILAAGEYAEIRRSHPDATVIDHRPGVILPGFIDAHTHFPQTRLIGGFGRPLLDWLRLHALPEEERMSGIDYAREIAGEFVRSLARHGTTTALVFGAHFANATAALFDAAARAGLRIASGLVVSDRYLPAPLLQTPDAAYRASKDLIARYHGNGLLRYAVTPRFALSASEAMLDVCGALMREHPDCLFQTHLNENHDEITAVRNAFPRAANYLDAYDRAGLATSRSVFAHNVHPSNAELARLAETRGAVAHCPSSNAALGSGLFPMRRHLDAHVRFALGTDVAAGTGFSLLRESLQSYLMQRVAAEGVTLTPAHMLWLATRAGAEALGLESETGDFAPGKSADFVVMRAAGPLGAVIAGAGPESIVEVRVAGKAVTR